MSNSSDTIQVNEATPDRWQDFEQLLGPNKGGSGGCWCMLWRLRKKEYDASNKEERRQAIADRFQWSAPPGLIAYDDTIPVGWCSISPRSEFLRLDTSRVLKPIDGKPVWSITCFYIARAYRRQGVSVKLLNGAAQFVRQRGGAIVEGYPIDPAHENYPTNYAWVGLFSAFKAAGFEEVARRSQTRPIMRKSV